MEHYKIDITQEQRDNLKKLADYLLSGNLRAEFDMENFSESHQHPDSKTCGSVGCAVGHGPYAGIMKDEYETWNSYSSRVFGCGVISTNHMLFTWCFDSDWKVVDNTSKGAAKRVLYVLKNGVPVNYLGQLYDDIKLPY